MDAAERAELLRMIRLLSGLSKEISPDDLAQRIVDEIEATGWNVTQPISIKRNESKPH
jgi:hypothetical protein